MDWYNVDSHSTVAVDFLPKTVTDTESNNQKERSLGGVLKNATMAWQAENCTLRVVSLQKEATLSSFTFYRDIYNCVSIVCVEQVISTINAENILLAVCLHSKQVREHHQASAASTMNSLIAIYSVKYNCVLSCFKLPLYVTLMRFMNGNECQRSLFQSFDGCLAVGTQEGEILIIDLYLNKLLKANEEQQKQLITSNINISDCKIANYDLPPDDIRRIYQKCLHGESISHFGLRIDVIDSTCAVESLLPIDLITGLAAGLEDGRLVIYDLIDLQIFYVSERNENHTPLVKMNYLEPPDDPKACLYILTLHDNGEQFTGDLHELMYEKRTQDENGCYFENFLRGSRKLPLQLEKSASTTISCQAISKLPTNADDDAKSLFVISWYSILEKQNKILIFDLNQWYKAEMPNHVNLRRSICYIACYQLKGNQCGLEAFVNPATITNFNSLQRCEEHFYPNSLSFDCLLLFSTGCSLYKWPGIQNRIINNLRSKNATLFLEPEQFFEEIRQTRLLPQFTELNVKATFSKTAMYEVILSVALEHNCIGLINDCIRSWADGSFTGNFGWQTIGTELSLRFLINWIWKRASAIKSRCNELCKGLLCPAGSYPLDQRGKKELCAITRQLKHLANLMDAIVKQQIKYNISEEELIITPKNESLRLASDYQNLILWLLNIGILPEKMHLIEDDNRPSTSRMTPIISSIYPFKKIRDFYAQKRATYAKINKSCIKKSGSCSLIFIDAFIEHECMQRSIADNTNVEGCNTLREHWQENGGNGLYPPATIESMLRIMLLPNISYDSKCSVLWYFFADLQVALNQTEQEDVKEIMSNLSKFPSVFQLSPALISNIQGFWHLDHGNFLAAVDEFLSPFNNTQNYDQWLIELQVESLLIQNAEHLAIRILDAHPNLIAPTLKLNILLSNNLIAEAFHFARSKDDDELMKRFFVSCLKMGNLGVIRDLALNEHEGQLVEQLLKRSQLPGAENLHFVYLLQKSKYIEAVSYMDELSTGKSLRSSNTALCNAIDAPDLVNSAMNTMAPETQRLTDVYFRIKNKIKKREANNQSPVPLSCQLLKQNANNLLGGLYHSSALSTHFASFYYDDELRNGEEINTNPLSARNAPFLRKPQMETYSEVVSQLRHQDICYPKEYERYKRKRENELETQEYKHQTTQLQQISKKRRLDVAEILTDLKRIKEQNLTLSDVGFNIAPIETPKELNESFMMKPVTETLSKSSELNKTEEISTLKPISSIELHGILKSGTPEPSEPRKLRRGESPAVEEKTLRFTLPSNEKEEIKEAEKKLNKIVTGTLSEDSCGSEDAENAEVTKYYSILPTIEKIDSLSEVSNKDSGISLTAKILGTQSSKTSLNQAARGRSDSPKTLGPRPRRPMTRSSAEPETQLRQTIFNTRSKVMNSITQEVDLVEGGNKTKDLKISSVVSLTSVEFAPMICSSKLSDTQTKFLSDQAKLSEYATVVTHIKENISSLETESKSSKIHARLPVSTFKEKAEPLLDTTLSMNTGDVTGLEMEISKEEDKLMQKNEQVHEDESVKKLNTDSLDFITAQSQLEHTEEQIESEETTDSQEALEIDSRHSRQSVESTNENSKKSITSQSKERDSQASTESEFGDSEELTVSDVGDSVVSEELTIDSESEESGESLILAIEEDEEEQEEEEEDSGESSEQQTDIQDNEDDVGPKRSDVIELLSSDEDDNVIQGNDVNERDAFENFDDNPEEEDDGLGAHNIEIEYELEVENVPPDSLEAQIESNDDEEVPRSSGNNAASTSEVNDALSTKVVYDSDSAEPEEKLNELLLQELKGEPPKMSSSDSASEASSATPVESAQSPNVEKDVDPKKDEVLSEDDGNKPAAQATIESEKAADSASETNNTKPDKIVQSSSVDKDEELDREKLKSANEEEHNKMTTEETSEPTEKSENLSSEKVKDSASEVSNTNQMDVTSSPNIEKDEELDSHVNVEIISEGELVSAQSIIKPEGEPKQQSTEENNESGEKSDDLTTETSNTDQVGVAHSSNIEKNEEPSSHDDIKIVLEVEEINSVTSSKLPEQPSEQSPIKESESSTGGNVNKLTSEESSRETKEIENNSDPRDQHTAFFKNEMSTAKAKTPARSLFESPYKRAHNLRSSKTEESTKSVDQENTSELKSTPRNNKRGQSMPPHSMLTLEENIETDHQTPKRRSTRGISVPPQAIDSSMLSKLNETAVPMTPTSKNRYSTRRNTMGESVVTPTSSNSSRSELSSNRKLFQLEHGSGTPLLDTPASRTRARLRSISESSDISRVSTPSTSVKKRRRPSISNRSDTEGTPGARRILLNEDDEEDTPDPGPSTSAQASFAESRRLTRKQRTLLETLHAKQAVVEVEKISNASLQLNVETLPKKNLRSTQSNASVKSHDDDDAESVTSSTASELRRSSRRLRSQQQNTSNPNLAVIPEQEDSEEGPSLRPKRTRSTKK